MTPRALVYGDIDLNLIDGSAIWLQSVTQALARAGCAVTLVLKAPVRTSRLIAPLLAEPGITVRRPFEEHLVEGPGSLRPAAATELLCEDRCRGPARPGAVARLGGGRAGGGLDPRPRRAPVDVPDRHTAVGPLPDRAEPASEPADRPRLALPALPDRGAALLPRGVCPRPPASACCYRRRRVLARARVADAARTPLRLVYTGKFAPRWNTLEMTQLPALLAARGVAPSCTWSATRSTTTRPATSSGCATRSRRRRDLARRALPPRSDAARRVLRHRAELAPSRARREPGAVHEGPRVRRARPAGHAQPHPDARGPARRGLPAVRVSVADVVAARPRRRPTPACTAWPRTGPAAAERFTLDRAAERLRGYLAAAVPAAAPGR